MHPTHLWKCSICPWRESRVQPKCVPSKLKSKLLKAIFNRGCVSNYLQHLLSNPSSCPCLALPTRGFWSRWKREWCNGNPGMCVFKSSTGDVRNTAFRSLSLPCLVLPRYDLMAIKALFHPLAKGIFQQCLLILLTLFSFFFIALTPIWHYIMYPLSFIFISYLSPPLDCKCPERKDWTWFTIVFPTPTLVSGMKQALDKYTYCWMNLALPINAVT